jgi:chaperonin GroEL
LNEKIPVFKPFANLVSAVKDAGRSLLIICDEIDGEGLAMLIANRHAVKTCPVNAPYSGEKRTELLKDIAAITGARYLSMASGIKPEKITLDMLGQADRCVIDEISTLIVNGQGNPEECQVRAQQVRDSIEKCPDASTREYLDKRLGSLDTGIASLRVGAPTEVERLELYDRVEDAINAVKAAFKEGISPGGGFALLKAAQTLEANRESIFKQDAPLDHSRAGWIAGFDIVLEGIKRPCFQILINAGFDPSEKLFSYYMREAEVNYSSFGFDSSTGNEVNLLLEGIIDPTFVITTALKDSISVSSMIMTTEAIVGTGKMPDRSSLMNGLPGMGM